MNKLVKALRQRTSQNDVEKLLKTKYTKRWKGKDGKWKYEYARPPRKRTEEIFGKKERTREVFGEKKGEGKSPISEIKEKTLDTICEAIEGYAARSSSGKLYVAPASEGEGPVFEYSINKDGTVKLNIYEAVTEGEEFSDRVQDFKDTDWISEKMGNLNEELVSKMKPDETKTMSAEEFKKEISSWKE